MENNIMADREPPLGEIFCANLFGHYMLIHWLTPLLRACNTSHPAKIIWVSSVEPQDYHFDESDLQGLLSTSAYEHGKRLTDILVLSSNQPGVAEHVTSFLAVDPGSNNGTKPLTRNQRPDNSTPSMHLFHPGILVTPIFPLPPVLFEAYLSAIYVARLLGGVWSNVQPYTAAHGVSHLLLVPDDEIQKAERAACPVPSSSSSSASSSQDSTHVGVVNGKVKWGTSIARSGTTTVRPTEVAWWGINGSGVSYLKGWWGGTGGRGRKPGAKEARPEDVEVFMGVAGRVWKDMELLRREWEGRIDRVDQLKI